MNQPPWEAQWLSGRVLDSRPSKGLQVRASPASLRWVLKQDTSILAKHGTTHEDQSLHNWKIVDGM